MKMSNLICETLNGHIHPSVKILAFIVISLLVSLYKLHALIALNMICLLLVIHFRAHTFLTLIKRLRWLFFFIFIIYAFTSPGEYVDAWPLQIKPTYEGVRHAILQILRLLLTLQALSILLTTVNKVQFISGLYHLIRPLKIHSDIYKKFLLRLWLTIDFIEKNKQKNYIHSLFNEIKLLEINENYKTSSYIEMQYAPLRVIDICFIIVVNFVLVSLALIP